MSCAARRRGQLIALQREKKRTKTCSGCGKTLPIGRFAHKDQTRAIRASQCKRCHAKVRRAYYEKNSDIEKARAEKAKRKKLQVYRDLKRSVACIRCGENHPAALHFHHRDASQKEFTLAKSIWHGYSIERIKAEIEKCDVLCANCHAKEHWPE